MDLTKHGPLDILNHYGFCPFCIAIKSYSSYVTARNRNEDQRADPRIITDPIRLTEWLYNQLFREGFQSFTLDSYSYAFIPVAVIKNTPLCTIHLWNETDPKTGRL